MEVRHALLSCPLLRRLPLAACRSRARAPPSTARRPAARKVLQHLVYARSAHEELLQQTGLLPDRDQICRHDAVRAAPGRRSMDRRTAAEDRAQPRQSRRPQSRLHAAAQSLPGRFGILLLSGRRLLIPRRLTNAARSRVHPFLRKGSSGLVALLLREAGCAGARPRRTPAQGSTLGGKALAWILRFGFHVIAARAAEDEQLGVRSDLGNRADEVHRPAAMRAGGRIPVLGRRARQITRIGSLFREAGTK